MYGDLGRIGLLVPSSNTTMECDFVHLLPDDVSLHTARIMHIEESEEELLAMADIAERGAKELASADIDLILFGCTSGSFAKGEVWNRQLSEKLSTITGKPVLTTSDAVKEALDYLAVKQVCLATPYPAETNTKATAWLGSIGVEVVETIELIESTYAKPVCNLEIGRLKPEEIYRRIRQKASVLSSPLFISCTNLKAINAIDRLESELNVSVVTSNQASLWAAMRAIEVPFSVDGFGRLLRG